jgi:hypothetical protein
MKKQERTRQITEREVSDIVATDLQRDTVMGKTQFCISCNFISIVKKLFCRL